jgi:predicted small metal-binding protein
MPTIISDPDKKLILEISDDKFSAYLTIKNNDEIIDEKEIITLLELADIKAGFKNASLFCQENNIKKEVNKKFLIALGEKPKIESSIDIKIDLSRSYQTDFGLDELEKCTWVAKDQSLAEVSLEENVKSARNVHGETISADKLRESSIKKYLGENLYFDSEARVIRAASYGYPYQDEKGRLHVKNKLNWEADIIDKSGVLYASLNLNGRLIGCQELVIFGDCNVLGVENSTVICSGKFKYKQMVDSATIIAENGIIGDESSSYISGHILSGGSIWVNTMGTPQDNVTKAELCISPFYKYLLLPKETINKHVAQMLPAASEDLESCFEKRLNATLANEQTGLEINVTHTLFKNTSLRILDHQYLAEKDRAKINFREKSKE